MGYQRDYPDYNNSGDTGEDTVDAIQPIADGEVASQSVFRRPSENLRSRTEIVRDTLRDLNYYRDAGWYTGTIGTGGDVSWGGVVSGGGTGIVSNTTPVTIKKLLTPRTSTKGSLSIGTATSNEITYTVDSSAYATDGMNNVLVEHRDNGAGASLTVSISEGPVYRIVVGFDSANSAHDAAAVKAAVDAAIAGDPFLNGKLNTTTDAVVNTAIAAQAETYIEGTADVEEHVVGTGQLLTLTTATPLQEGDAVALWYRSVVEEGTDPLDPKAGVPGGRWESNPDRGNTTVNGNLFITTEEPEKIPGAIVLFKVVDDKLVWFDGSTVVKGGSMSAFSTSYDVAIDTSAWTNDVSNTFNRGLYVAPGSTPALQSTLDSAHNRLGELRAFTWTITDGGDTFGGDYDSPDGLANAISAIAGRGGALFVRGGGQDLPNPTTVPADTTITGEGRDLLQINLVSGGTYTVSSNCLLENMYFNAQGPVTFIVNADSELRNCSFGSSIVTLQLARNAKLDNVAFLDVQHIVQSDGTNGGVLEGCAGSFDLNMDGALMQARNCVINGDVTITDENVLLDSCNITLPTATGAGVSAFSIQPTGSGVMRNCVVTHDAGTSGAIALWSDTPLGFTVTDTHFNCNGLGIVCRINGKATFDSCRIVQNNTGTSSPVIQTTSVGGDEETTSIKFLNCIIDDSENMNNTCLEADVPALNNLHKTHLTLDHCIIKCVSGSGANNTAITLRNAAVNDTKVVLQPPLSAGRRQFAGAETSYVAPQILLTEADVRNLVIDGADAEVEINSSGAGNPLFNGDALLLDGENVTIDGLSLTNLNRHLNTAALTIFENSMVRNVAADFTATGAVGGGSALLLATVSCKSKTTIRDSHFQDHVHISDAATNAGHISLADAADYVKVENCVFEGTKLGIVYAATTHYACSVIGCQFGTLIGNAVYGPVWIPASTRFVFSKNIVTVDTASGDGRFLEFRGTTSLAFISDNLFTETQFDGTLPNTSHTDFGTNTVSNITIRHNRTFVTAVAGTREVYANTGSVLATQINTGNVFTDTGGTYQDTLLSGIGYAYTDNFYT